jgi:predicted MPP superfamily phosphohydrolase
LGLNSLSSFEGYNILLSHRPEEFDIYANSKYDLVLTGHAHGGQVRIPFIGGLVAPNQGLFPEYDSGIFTSNNTTMVVSRGIGNSIIKLRVNNRPEIVLIELSK